MGFLWKKIKTKTDFSQENNLFSPTFIYLTGHQAVKWIKKNDSSMIWTKSILMAGKVRLKILKRCSV